MGDQALMSGLMVSFDWKGTWGTVVLIGGGALVGFALFFLIFFLVRTVAGGGRGR